MSLVVVHERFVVAQPVQLKLKEKMISWSGDDIKIKELSTQETWFKVKGKALSFSDKKEFIDAYGNTLATMKQPQFSWKTRMEVSGAGFQFQVTSLQYFVLRI